MNSQERGPLKLSIPHCGFNLAGGVKVLVYLANGMAARGWQVWFIEPDYASESPFQLSSGVGVTALTTGPAWLPLMVRKLIYYLKLMFLAARGAHICLANYYLTAYCAVVSKCLFSRKSRVVWYVQGDEAVSHGLLAEANRTSRILRYLVAQFSYRLPASIVCVSNWVRSRIGHPESVVAHAPALDLEVFRPKERVRAKSLAVVGTIGRKGDTKGYDHFLQATRLLPDPSVVKVLVASPTLNEVQLPSEVLAESIHARTEQVMADFYNQCDVFVLPSIMEAFPLPPLEAMACGCAVVVTACGGVGDYAQDGVNCLVVPPGDSLALARAVWTLCQDPFLRERLVQEGLVTARRFEKHRMAERFLDLVVDRANPLKPPAMGQVMTG